MNLKKQAQKLPKGPGVYLFLNSKREVLYVGRATVLRHRVLSYFQQQDDRPQIGEMVTHATRIKHYSTDTVLEAVLLEANLIRKHWPKYNLQDGDDRYFVYIVIDKSDFPKPIVVRGRELQKFPPPFRVFGPYKSDHTARTALKIMRRIFPYSMCIPNSGQPCFEYQIGHCPGVCVGKISARDYQKNITNLILMLRGEKKRLYRQLQKEDPTKAESLRHIQDVALTTKENHAFMPQTFHRIEGYDISHLAGKETYGAMVVFSGGHADKSAYRLFKIKKAPASDDLAALAEMIERRFKHLEWPFPDIILVDGGQPQVHHIFKFLQERHITIPLIGISKYTAKYKISTPDDSSIITSIVTSATVRDKLVFPPGSKKPFKELAQSTKTTLLQVRDEAHRFAQAAHRRRRKSTNNIY